MVESTPTIDQGQSRYGTSSSRGSSNPNKLGNSSKEDIDIVDIVEMGSSDNSAAETHSGPVQPPNFPEGGLQAWLTVIGG